MLSLATKVTSGVVLLAMSVHARAQTAWSEMRVAPGPTASAGVALGTAVTVIGQNSLGAAVRHHPRRSARGG